MSNLSEISLTPAQLRAAADAAEAWDADNPYNSCQDSWVSSSGDP